MIRSGYIFLLLFCWIQLSACKSSKNIPGSYFIGKSPKTVLQINPDKTFKLINITKNPYLFTSEHVNQMFCISTGKWKTKNKTLILTSLSDSIKYDLVKIESDSSKGENYSKFKFYDLYNDSVDIAFVQYPDNSRAEFGGHNKLYSYKENLKNVESLEFHFYGYHPWKIVSKSKTNAQMKVYLIPEYRPSFYRSTKFKIKANSLLEKKNKVTFVKKNVG